MKIVFHIGQPKTGTTTLQRSLASSAAHLRELGVLYPKVARRGTGHHLLTLLAERERDWSLDWIGPADTPRDLRGDLLDEIEHAGADTVVLSTEALFEGFDPRPLLASLAEPGWAVGVVAFLRRQDLHLEASYAQRIKTGATKQGPAEFLQRYVKRARFDYLSKLDKWAQVVGWDAVTAIPYEPDVAPYDVIDRFETAVGITGLARVEWRNQRMARDALELLRLMPAERRVGDSDRGLRRALEAWSSTVEQPAGWSFFYGLGQRKDLFERCRDSNAELARRLPTPAPGFFAGEPAVDSEPYPGLTPARSAEISRFLWEYARTLDDPAGGGS